MGPREAWAAYLYPPPHATTLRNLLNILDAGELQELETLLVGRRQRQLVAEPDLVTATFDAAHVRALHGYLFQDVYAWAGQYRTVTIRKGVGRDFATPQEIDRYLADVHRLATTTAWSDLDLDAFAVALADVLAHLNQAHPFREGNGRTAKVFLDRVAEASRFRLDYARVPPSAWNTASMLSAPDLGRYEPVPDSLVLVLRACAVPRP